MDALVLLALMSKANAVFGDPNNPELFLSFPFTYPIGYQPEQLDFASAFSNPTVGHTLADLSLNLNSLPTGTLFEGPRNDYLWDNYAQWLNDMVLAEDQMTADERAQYQEANAVLLVTDGSGFSVDSPVVVAYKQYRDAWFAAEQNYKNEQITAINSSDPEVQSRWTNIDEPRLRALVEEAMSDWENKGDKTKVESARAVKAQLDARSPSTAWNEWSGALIKDIDMPSDPVSNMSYAPTGFSPADLFTQNWPTFQLSKDEIVQLTQSAPDELRKVVANPGTASNITSLSFEFRSAALVRPWLDTDVFKARFWKFRDGTLPLSNGGTPPQGSWPAYISAVVFARNIAVTTQSAPQPQYLRTLAISENILNAGASIQVVRDHRADASRPAPATIRDHRTDLTGPGSTARRLFASGLGARAMMAERTTESTASPAAPQTSKSLAFTRLTTATYRMPSGIFLRGTSSSDPASAGPASQPETGTPDSSVSILAFICRKLPQTPNPDLSLNWAHEPTSATDYNPTLHMSNSDKKTDDSKLVTTDTVYVSADSGTTDEAFPKPDVEYDFCVDVANAGQLPSGSFFVRFTLSGDQDPPKDLDFTQDDGLDAGATVKAVVHFGSFPNKFATYHLEACIYSSAAPENPINCAGSFDITVNTESTSDSASAAGSDDTNASDSAGGGGDSTTAQS